MAESINDYMAICTLLTSDDSKPPVLRIVLCVLLLFLLSALSIIGVREREKILKYLVRSRLRPELIIHDPVDKPSDGRSTNSTDPIIV